MNFKPTLWKTIISIIVGLLVFFLSFPYTCRTLETIEQYYAANGKCSFSFSWYTILGFIIAFVIIYSIWSLLENT